MILERLRVLRSHAYKTVRKGVPKEVFLELQKIMKKGGDIAVVAGMGRGYYPVIVTKLSAVKYVVILDEWDLSVCLDSEGMKRFLSTCGSDLKIGRVSLLKKGIDKLERDWVFSIDFLLIDCSGIIQAARFLEKLTPFVKKGGDIVIAGLDKLPSTWKSSVPQVNTRSINGVVFSERG